MNPLHLMTPEEKLIGILGKRDSKDETTSEVQGQRLWKIIDEMVAAKKEQCARIAEQFTICDPGTHLLHPDVAWKNMNQSAQGASHTTAQLIAAKIREVQ